MESQVTDEVVELEIVPNSAWEKKFLKTFFFDRLYFPRNFNPVTFFFSYEKRKFIYSEMSTTTI